MSGDVPSVASEAERRRILSGLMLIMFLGALAQLVVAPALPTISAELGDVEHLPWVVTAYLLAAAVSTPVLGKMSDIYSRRRMLLASLAVFLVGSTLCALAPSVPLLAVARAVQGIGGGALIALAQATIGDVIPPRERGRYQAYIGTAFASASLGGRFLAAPWRSTCTGRPSSGSICRWRWSRC
jgi:MFS family permease